MDYERIHVIYRAKDLEDADEFEQTALNYLCGYDAKMVRVAIANVPTDGWEEATLLNAQHVGIGVAKMSTAFAQTRNVFHYGKSTVSYGRTYGGHCLPKRCQNMKLPALEFIAEKTEEDKTGPREDIDKFIRAVGKTKRNFYRILVY